MPMTMPARPSATSARASRFGGGLERAGEQGDAGAGRVAVELAGAAERAEQLADAAGVLGGEDLGGGEQGGLAARVDDLGHGPQRDDGLAGADLALQQPVHRLVAVELGGELLPHVALALGEARTGRAASTASSSPPGRAGPGDAGFERGGAAAGGEGELEDQRLVPLEPVGGALDVLDRGGPVDVEQRGGEGEQPVPGADLLGERVDDELAEAAAGAEQQLDRLLDDPAGDVLARRVDRDEGARPVVVVVRRCRACGSRGG